MNKNERATTIAFLCSQLTGNEVSPNGDKIYFNNPTIQRIASNARQLLMTPTGRVSSAGVQALNRVAPHIHLDVIERSENYKVLYARLVFPTQAGMRSLTFIDV